MEKSKFDVNKYIERLEGYSDNFSEMIEENGKNIADFNEKIEKDTKAIEALGSYFKREEGENSKSLKEFEKSIAPYQEDIKNCENNIRNIEKENEKLTEKGRVKGIIINKIIKDATEEFNKFEDNINSKIEKNEQEKQNKKDENVNKIKELRNKIEQMDRVGNAKNRETQEKLEAEIESLRNENSKIEKEYEKANNDLDKELINNKIEFKRKINEKYLNSKEVGKLIKTNKEETKQEETKQKETKQEETKQKETKQEETKQEETKQKETKQEETKQEETKQKETKQEETKQEETKQKETKQEETKQEKSVNPNKSYQTEKFESMRINAEKGKIYYTAEGRKEKVIPDISIEEVFEQKKLAFKRIGMSERIEEAIGKTNILTKMRLMREIDPLVIKALEVSNSNYEDVKKDIKTYIRTLKNGDGKLPITYEMAGNTNKELSKYAKIASELELADVEGMDITKPNRIIGMFGKIADRVKELASRAKIKLLGAGNPEYEENSMIYTAEKARQEKETMEDVRMQQKESENNLNMDSILHKNSNKFMDTIIVPDDVKNNINEVSAKFSVTKNGEKIKSTQEIIDEHESIK